MNTESLDTKIKGLKSLMCGHKYLPSEKASKVRNILKETNPQTLGYIASQNIEFVSDVARNILEGGGV